MGELLRDYADVGAMLSLAGEDDER